jgi:hypothetical protein
MSIRDWPEREQPLKKLLASGAMDGASVHPLAHNPPLCCDAGVTTGFPHGARQER